MPAPVSQQIADAILAALREISTAAGDAATPDVEEATSLGNIPTDQKFVLVEVDGENTDDAPEQAIEYLTNYVLFVFVHEPPDSGLQPAHAGPLPPLRRHQEADGDYQWGGLAVDTKVTRVGVARQLGRLRRERRPDAPLHRAAPREPLRPLPTEVTRHGVDSPLITRTRVFAAKAETTTGTAQALTSAEGVFNVMDPDIQEDSSRHRARRRRGRSRTCSRCPGAMGGKYTFKTEVYNAASRPGVALHAADRLRVAAQHRRLHAASTASTTFTLGAFQGGSRLKRIAGAWAA
jgi:hypothetical protein